MDRNSSDPAGTTLARTTLLAYLIGLLGVLFGVDAGLALLRNGTTAEPLLRFGAALAILIASGAVYLDPNGRLGSTEPASTMLYVLAAIATVAVLVRIGTEHGGL